MEETLREDENTEKQSKNGTKVDLLEENVIMDDTQDNYLYFSSLEMIDYFCNNLADKDIKTQTKRIFEMARVFMDKKDFVFEDIYSVLVMVRDMEMHNIINDVFCLYFKAHSFPIRAFVQMSDLEGTADIEMEFSAYRGEKKYIQSPNVAMPEGPFSQGVIVEDFVHCSGVLPSLPNRVQEEVSFPQQVRQCLSNLAEILKSAGTCLENAYAFVVYLKDLENITQVEEVFSEYFSNENDIIQEVVKIDRLEDNQEVAISCSAFLSK